MRDADLAVRPPAGTETVAGYGLAAEITSEHVAAMALDRHGQVLGQARRPLDHAATPTAAVLAEVAEAVAGLVGGVAAPIGSPAGLTVAAHDPLGGAGVDPVEDVRRRLAELLPADHTPLPVRAAAPAQLAAVAELRIPESNRTEMLVLHGGTTLGAGVVTGGRLATGQHGTAGRIGHLRVDPNGRSCRCGRVGCWETVVGVVALLEAATDPDDPVRDPALDRDSRLALLVQRARVGDSRTHAALQRVGGWLGRGATALVAALDPGVVVLGGYFAAVGEWLVPTVEAELAAAGQVTATYGPRVEVSSLDATAVLRGGALLALEHWNGVSR